VQGPHATCRIQRNPLSCPWCFEKVALEDVAWGSKFSCPTCGTSLQVTPIYKANLTIGAFVIGFAAAFAMDPSRYLLGVAFLFALSNSSSAHS
jgi:hypothetical protein